MRPLRRKNSLTRNCSERQWKYQLDYYDFSNENGASLCFARQVDTNNILNLICLFFLVDTIEIYKQWIADGKKIPLEDIIELTTKLICDGVNGLAAK